MSENEFLTFAEVHEIPAGERMIIEVDGRWIVVLNVDGEFYAVADVCTHDDGPLSEGEVIGCEIECPRHGARFDIRTGGVTAPPALVDIPTYDIRVQGNDLQISRQRRKKF
jgi:3-phenylpropionate/trans-cinnamate dioxygenase ferredoxin component